MVMSKAQTIAAIKAVNPNFTVKLTDGEWRVSFNVQYIMLLNQCDNSAAKLRNETVAYYTDCAEDAVATAQVMQDCAIKNGRI
jgi:hypothetical protein